MITCIQLILLNSSTSSKSIAYETNKAVYLPKDINKTYNITIL